jgi:hypothetical protein
METLASGQLTTAAGTFRSGLRLVILGSFPGKEGSKHDRRKIEKQGKEKRKNNQ